MRQLFVINILKTVFKTHSTENNCYTQYTPDPCLEREIFVLKRKIKQCQMHIAFVGVKLYNFNNATKIWSKDNHVDFY